MRQPLVVTIILNTNRRNDTLECLTSLRANTYPRHQVLVLDNASTDGSVEAISDSFPEVRVLSLAENRGYTGNNNVGIAAALDAGADWVLLLNEDTILAPDALALMVAAGERDRMIGIVGPLVLHHDEPTVIQSAGGRIDRSWYAWHLAQNQPITNAPVAPTLVDWVSGCAIMVRREVIAQVGMLDERFFYYWEETEWCIRTRRAGWQIVLEPAARLWHKGVQRNYRPKPSVSYYDTRNQLLLLRKHRAPLGAWLAIGGRRLRTVISYSLRSKWRDHRDHRDAMVRGTLDFLSGRWGRGPV